MQVEPKTCIAIFRTPVPAILNHTNLTGLAGGARESQNIAHLGHINAPTVPYFDLPLPLLYQFLVSIGKQFSADYSITVGPNLTISTSDPCNFNSDQMLNHLSSKSVGTCAQKMQCAHSRTWPIWAQMCFSFFCEELFSFAEKLL